MRQSIIEQKHFAVRIDKIYTTTSEKILLYVGGQAPLCKRILMTKETSERTEKEHWHLYFEYLSEVKKSTLDKRLQRAFANRGGQMSKAICKKPEQYLTYICKDLSDTNKVSYNKGFSKEDIADYKERSYKKKNRPNIPFQIYTEIKGKYLEDIPTYEDIQSFVVRWYKSHNKAMIFSYMAGIVFFIHSMYSEQDVIQSFIEYMN